MDKEFHLYTAHAPEDRVDAYNEVMELIEKDTPIIKTTQVLACTTKLFEQDYRIFVHTEDDDFEITLGRCARTNREIRMAHNLPKLITNGEFCCANENVNIFYAITLTILEKGDSPTAMPYENTYVYVFDTEEKRDEFADELEEFDEDGYVIDENYDAYYRSEENRRSLLSDMDEEALYVSSKSIEEKPNGYFVGRYKLSEDERSIEYEYKMWLD